MVYHRSSDWGQFDDFIEIYQGKKRIVFEHLKEGNPQNGSHDGKMPLVDSFLPAELGQYRNLLRPPGEFTYYHSKMNNLPPGYNWVATSRYTPQKRQEDVNAIEILNKLLWK